MGFEGKWRGESRVFIGSTMARIDGLNHRKSRGEDLGSDRRENWGWRLGMMTSSSASAWDPPVCETK